MTRAGSEIASVKLSIPKDGIVFGGLVLRLPTTADIDEMPPAFADPDAPTRDDLAEFIPRLKTLVASGQIAPLLVVDVETGEPLGGGTLRHLDSKRAYRCRRPPVSRVALRATARDTTHFKTPGRKPGLFVLSHRRAKGWTTSSSPFQFHQFHASRDAARSLDQASWVTARHATC